MKFISLFLNKKIDHPLDNIFSHLNGENQSKERILRLTECKEILV